MTGKKVKPKLFSKEWFKHFFSALKFWEYDARDLAIWQLSSWQTIALWAGAGKLFSYLTANVLPASLLNFGKAAVVKVTTFFSAVVFAVSG